MLLGGGGHSNSLMPKGTIYDFRNYRPLVNVSGARYGIQALNLTKLLYLFIYSVFYCNG